MPRPPAPSSLSCIRPRGPAARLACALVVAGLLLGGCGSSEEGAVRLPAEWEPHEAVWVSFFGAPVDSVAYQIVRAVASQTPVKAIIPDMTLGPDPTSKLAYVVRARLGEMGVDLERVEFVRTDSVVQVRDTGPIFVRTDEGGLQVVDFRWNGYGAYPFPPAGSNGHPFDSLMAARLELPVVRSTLAMEGGAMEVNGRGTILQVESVTLQRNPGRTKEEIEAELKRVLGQKKVIWLKEGPAEDPYRLSRITGHHIGQGVGGHVDEFCRFVDARTILLAMPDSAEAAADPVKRITYERMQVNYEILRAATDQDGQPFEIIRVPVPSVPYAAFPADTSWSHPSFRALLDENPDIRHGDTLHWVPAASYLNFFVTNGVVLLPQYWQPGLSPSVREKDESMRRLLERYYPDRKIVGVNPLMLNNNGGGLHCWVQQQPAG